MSEESKEEKESCCGVKQDLTKEAQRTNRFNKNYSFEKSASSCLTTTCNRIESTTGITNDYKTEQTDDLPCINIILKPILDTNTEQINKCIHFVELNAVTENSNKHSVSDTNNSNPDQCQSSFKELKGVGMKNVKVQIDVEKKFHDNSTQTTQTSTDYEKTICASSNKETTPKVNVEDLTTGQLPSDTESSCKPNRGVQFRDDNINCSDRGIRNGVDTTRQDTSPSLVECSDSMETLYKLVNNDDKSKNSTEFKSGIENSGLKTRGKLSDRIKRNIDKMKIGSCVFGTKSLSDTEKKSQVTREESMKTTCTDTCKDIASQIELFKTYSEKSNSVLATQNTSTLPSVLSNNSPIPRVSINTTDSKEWESPSNNKPTMDTTISESSFSPSSNNTPCCSDQKFSIREEKNSNVTEEDIEKFNNDTGTRGFWDDQTTTLSKLGISGNLSVETESTDTVSEASTLKSMPGLPVIDNESSSKENGKCCISTAVQTDPISFSPMPDTKFGDKSDSVLPRANNRNLITASELTRPEFIRMLTEIKEHTRSLELQLSAMNEAMKRKQATRNKAASSALKNYRIIGEEDLVDYKMKNKRFKTTNEHARCTLGEFVEENLIDNSCCATPDRNSLLEGKYPENRTVNDETCCPSVITSEPNESCNSQDSSTNLKTSSRMIVAQDESDTSISRRKGNKPAFKTKKCYLRAPLRQSDYRIWKQKLEKRVPSIKSMTVSEMLSRSLSPSTSIDLSCSPTNCCNPSEDSLQKIFETGNLSPINKLENSATYSTTSNPSVDRILMRPTFMSSTIKNETQPSLSTNNKYIKPSDCRAASTTTLVPSCESDRSRYSNDGKECCESIKVEPAFETGKQNGERKEVSTSPVKLKQSKLKPRLGVKQSSFKSRVQSRPKSIPSNSYLCSSEKKESFHAGKPSPSQLKESMNNCSKYDSEEEMGSTDYGVKRCVEDTCGKESKDSQNGKKRNWNSGGKKITKMNEKSELSDSNSPKVRNWQNNSHSSQNQEHSGHNSISSKNNSQSINGNQNSVKFKKFHNVSGKSNNKKTDSQQKDSKCTIRVTVSLDETETSNEGVNKV